MINGVLLCYSFSHLWSPEARVHRFNILGGFLNLSGKTEKLFLQGHGEYFFGSKDVVHILKHDQDH